MNIIFMTIHSRNEQMFSVYIKTIQFKMMCNVFDQDQSITIYFSF